MEKQVIREINTGSWKSTDDYDSIINLTNIYKIIKSTTIENGLNPEFIQRTTSGEFELSNVEGNTSETELLSYYDSRFPTSVRNGDSINIQALLSEIDIKNFDNNNVYIKNYKTNEKLLKDVVESVSIENIEDYLKIDLDNLSINFELPSKIGEEVQMVLIYPIGRTS